MAVSVGRAKGALLWSCYESYEAGESRETARRLGREQLRANFAASPVVRRAGRALQNRLADAGYLQWSGACFPIQGASPLPGSFLLACLFCAEKWIFPENFCTLHNIDLLQLPQTPPKFNLANKKDQVSFSSDRDNVSAGRYCTKNKQAFPQTPHWSPTSITVLVYNAVGLSCNPQNLIPRRPWIAASDSRKQI